MGDSDNKQDLKINTLETNYSNMANKIDDLSNEVKKGFSDIKSELKAQRDDSEQKFVTKEKFEPVRLITYGFVALILIAVIGAMINQILTT